MTIAFRLWHRIPTVTAKFLLILIPILVVSTLGFSAVYFYAKYSDLRTALQSKVAAIAEINAVALSSSLWAFDAPSTQHIIQAISINPELRCIAVSDDLAGSRYFWPEDGCDAGRGNGDDRVRRDINVQNRRLGSITLHFGYESVDRQILAEVVNSLWLLLLLLVGTVVTALTAHRVTISQPLNRLIESIRLTEERHVRHRVDWSSADELGRVIQAYNRMLERLTAEEAALRQSEERLSLAITATRSAVWDLNLRTGQFWWSAEFPSLIGYGADELAMDVRTWESLVHPDDVDHVLADVQRHLRGETAAFSTTYRVRCKDGSWIWIEDKATAIRDETGIAFRLTGTMSDVTARVQGARELAHERNILQITLDNVDQGIVMVDGDLNVMLSNRRAAEILNVEPEFLAARPSYPDVARRQVERGEPVDFAEESEDQPWPETGAGQSAQPSTVKRRRADGTIVEVRTNPLSQGGFVRTFSDITVEARSAEEIFHAMQELEHAYAELKETQASLVQAEKMASLALLVAGVAHEINTPVGIAYGCATHLGGRTRDLVAAFEKGALKKSDLGSYVKAAAEASRLIQQNLNRAAELIQSFKRVAVDQTSQERRRFDLRTYLNEIVTSLGPQIRHSQHRITVECPEGIETYSFPGALSQVITNLVMNALVHAFEQKPDGRMTLAVEQIAGDEVEIRFSDDGKGIPGENLNKIFEPFFTTKRGSGGSGLGLHIVFNLVTQSLGGRITVASTPGQGTTFTMRIPTDPPTRA